MTIEVKKMVTSIQLDEAVKDQLAEIARQLELDLKEKVTYNDVIKFLLKSASINKDKIKINNLRGIISVEEAKKAMQELRNLEKIREKRLAI